MPEALTVWTNQTDGNNHSVSIDGETLTLKVVKPDGAEWSDSQRTMSSPAQWQQAFGGLGSKWNQVQGSEQKEGGRYRAIRTARTASEIATWEVDHEKVDEAQTTIRDRLSIALRTEADQD